MAGWPGLCSVDCRSSARAGGPVEPVACGGRRFTGRPVGSGSAALRAGDPAGGPETADRALVGPGAGVSAGPGGGSATGAAACAVTAAASAVGLRALPDQGSQSE